MKNFASFETPIGGDGAKASGSIGVDGSNLKIQVSAEMPIEKIIVPATTAIDNLLNKVKSAIPGDWDDALIEKFKVEYKEELIQLLSEKQG